MDSLTQLTLGAAVGYVVAGRQHGYKAAIAGAVCGTLPDLDVLLTYDDPITAYASHRAETHSVFWLTVVTPAIALVLARLMRIQISKSWALGVWLALITHPILDAFTVYGTSLWLPFSSEPVSWSSAFIIDPRYTLPLLVGLVMGLIKPEQWRRWPQWGLAFSSVYLLWSLGAKTIIDNRVEASLAQQNIPYTRYLSTPGPMVYWRVVVMADTGFYEALPSVFSSEPIYWQFYPSRVDLLKQLSHTDVIQKFIWFSRGFYRVSVRGGLVVVSDLRMGLEPLYVFNFAVGKLNDPMVAVPLTPPEQLESSFAEILGYDSDPE